MVLDPLHKEVIVATAAGNTVETFYVPEAFEPQKFGATTSMVTPQ